MRLKVAVLAIAAVLAVGVLPLFGSPAYAADRQTPKEYVVLAALGHLITNYPEEITDAKIRSLFNAAIDGIAKKIERPDLLKHIPDGENPVTWYEGQRDLAFSVTAGKFTMLELEFAATAAMLESLDDSHTFFIPPDAAQNIRSSMFGGASYVGVGIYLFYRDNRTYVWEVFPGSPAEQAGVKKFDRLLKVDDTVIDGLAEDAANKNASKLRGTAGTTVNMTVLRPGSVEPMTITITRAPITIELVTSRMLPNGVGYVRIREFEDDVSVLFSAAIKNLTDQGMKAMVLDLRHNPGGYEREMKKVISALLPERVPIEQTTSRHNPMEIGYSTGTPELDPRIPLVVLVDQASASAAEITAAAIQEYQRGVVVGVRTAGAVESGDLRGSAR